MRADRPAAVAALTKIFLDEIETGGFPAGPHEITTIAGRLQSIRS
jgi:hypothetical protein